MVTATTREARFAPRTLAALTDRLLARRASEAGCADALRTEVADALSHRDRSDLFDQEDPSADSDATTALMLAEWVERRLWEVDQALARVDAGTYGYCIDCDGPIPLERLRALPATSRCLGCSHQFANRDRLRTNKVGGRSLPGFGPAARRGER